MTKNLTDKKLFWFSKIGRLPEGVYIEDKPASCHPVVYFRKPKYATKEEYEIVLKELRYQLLK